jgi:nucleoside recognition membrane protein YjiH
MGLSEEQITTIATISHMTGTMSIIGSSAVLITVYTNKKLQTQINTMICMAALSDLFSGLACGFGSSGIAVSWLCQVQGFLIQYFLMSSVIWTFCIATHCFLAISTMTSISKLSWIQKYYHAFAWGVPLVFACLPFGFDSMFGNGSGYGSATLW